MKQPKISLTLIALLIGFSANAQVTLRSELKELADVSRLPLYRSGTIEAGESTYDRKGGNNDGFGGTYSFVAKNPDGSLVMLDIDGPGVLNRIATPTPTKDTLDFYIDHNSKPALSICYLDLFSGKVTPFTAPLCGSAVGGYYCYFPILFNQHLKIVCRGKHLQFHQLGYRLFPKGTKVASFAGTLSAKDKAALDEVRTAWQHTGFNGQIQQVTQILTPGQAQTIFNQSKGGRITGITLDTAGTEHLRLRVYWDGEAAPAIDCPLRTFFGYAFGRPAMEGLLSGTNDRHYAWFPMPFDRSARIELLNEGPAPTTVTGQVSYTRQKRDAKTEGRFYADYHSEHLEKTDPYHVLLDVQGRGHEVGVILQGKANFNGQAAFWEGDDTTATDGQFRIHGTGTEDFFNGGWYDIAGKWSQVESRPLSGCMGYGKTPAHSGGYRFLLSDKIPFENSIYQAIEHGRSAKDGIPADYTSVVFYYCDRNNHHQP